MKAALGLIGISLLLVVFVGCSGEAVDKQSRDAAFQELFGFAPTSDVTDVRTAWRKNPVHYVRWVRAGCGIQTMATIRTRAKAWPQKFVIFTAEPGLHHPKVDAPTWWKYSVLVGEPDRFILPGRTSARVDVVYVWADVSAGIVYASRNVAR